MNYYRTDKADCIVTPISREAMVYGIGEADTASLERVARRVGHIVCISTRSAIFEVKP